MFIISISLKIKYSFVPVLDVLFVVFPTLLRYTMPLLFLPFLVHLFSDCHTNIFGLCFLETLSVCLLFKLVCCPLNEFLVSLNLLFLFSRLYQVNDLVEAG